MQTIARTGSLGDTPLEKRPIEKLSEMDTESGRGGEGGDAIDTIDAQKVIRKIDYRLVPLLMLIYCMTFLDRVNIGNARLWHMERDLHMTGYQYNIVVLVFYIPLIIFEVPSNMLITRITPRYYISALVMGWGLSVTFAGFATSFAGLLVARIFIGFFESGMLPACLFLIGNWYKRHELLTRVAWLLVANDVAGTASGLLGAGLGSLDGTGGYSGWQWIFFIEGAMTCTVGILAFFFVLPFPEDSTFLSPEEKKWLLQRLRKDDGGTGNGEKMDLKMTLRMLRDWKVICSGVLYLSVTVPAYAISVFQPTILKTFGWSDLKSNLLSAPVRAVSGIFSVLVGIWSDKTERRGIFCIGGFSVAIMGNLFVLLFRKGSLRYMGIYFAAIGTYICQPLVLAWGVNQVVGTTKRGTLSGFAVGFGQIGGIISAVVFPSKDSPRYIPGVATCIAFSFLGILAAACMWGICAWENRQRELGKRDHLRDLPEEDQATLGEKHPDFRYTL